MQAIVILSALCGGILAVSNRDCPYSGQSWVQDTGYFLDCINQEIEHDVNIIDTKQRDREQELITIFNRHSTCGSYFQKTKTHDQSTNFQDLFQNSDLTKVLQDSRNNFFANSGGSTNLIADAVTFLRKVIWTIAESETMSSCLINNLRDRFLTFMNRCLGDKTGDSGFQFGKALDLLPVTPRNKIQFMQRYVEEAIKAYIVVKHCSLSDRQAVIDDMVATSDGDVCRCAKANFVSCPRSYNDVCPQVDLCIKDLINDPKPLLDSSAENSLTRVVFNCFRDAKDKNDLPFLAKSGQSGLDFLKDLRETGQKLIETFNQMNGDQKKQFGEFVKQVAEAHFKADFCKKCRL